MPVASNPNSDRDNEPVWWQSIWQLESSELEIDSRTVSINLHRIVSVCLLQSGI